jgi:hypothetical protein
VWKVDLLEGVSIVRSEKVMDEVVLDGNDIVLVFMSCALNDNNINNLIYIYIYIYILN